MLIPRPLFSLSPSSEQRPRRLSRPACIAPTTRLAPQSPDRLVHSCTLTSSPFTASKILTSIHSPPQALSAFVSRPLAAPTTPNTETAVLRAIFSTVPTIYHAAPALASVLAAPAAVQRAAAPARAAQTHHALAAPPDLPTARRAPPVVRTREPAAVGAHAPAAAHDPVPDGAEHVPDPVDARAGRVAVWAEGPAGAGAGPVGALVVDPSSAGCLECAGDAAACCCDCRRPMSVVLLSSLYIFLRIGHKTGRIVFYVSAGHEALEKAANLTKGPLLPPSLVLILFLSLLDQPLARPPPPAPPV